MASRPVIETIDGYRAQAQAAMQAGEPERAAAILEKAAGLFPNDAALWNSAGAAALRAGKTPDAAAHFAKARERAPQTLEFAVNHAIALGRLGRHSEALTVLGAHERSGVRDVRYCSTRANTSRDAGLLKDAARWYDAALAIDAGHARALHGRARVALERAETDAVVRFDRALQRDPANLELWLGKAQALEVEGRNEEAEAIAAVLVSQAPRWLAGLRFKAELLMAQGVADVAAPYRDAAARAPQDPQISIAHCALLAGIDRKAEAAEVAANARRRFPELEQLALLEAIYAGEDGQDERAEAIWAEFQFQSSTHHLHEARHRVRQGEPERAVRLIDSLLQADRSNVAGWALRGLLWRLLDDPRKDWLHGQEGLVQFLPLHDRDTIVPQTIEALHALHDSSCFPLGQSLRGGTQTRAGLFDRYEPIYEALHRAIIRTLGDYRAKLPPAHSDHPLLRHRDDAWSIAGSWSVRLAGGGDHHTSHIHPNGIVSSALYLEIPDDIDAPGEPGWLEIGRPPPDLRLELPPLFTIRPQPGHLALFPSTLYHGTRPFDGARRLTVAFDVCSHPRRSDALIGIVAT